MYFKCSHLLLMSSFDTLTDGRLKVPITHAFSIIFSGRWFDDTEKSTGFDGIILHVDITFDISNFLLMPLRFSCFTSSHVMSAESEPVSRKALVLT